MRSASKIYVAVLIYIISACSAYALTPQAPVPQSIIQNGIVAPMSQNDIYAQNDEESPPKAPKLPLPAQDKRPLLPERPKDFNPMIPPSPLSSDVDGSAFPPAPPGGMPMMFIAQLGAYTAQLTAYTRLLLLVATGALFLFFVLIIFLYGTLKQTRKSVEAARISLQLSEHNNRIVKETSEKELRAYVFTNGAKGELAADKSGAYSVRVEIKNFGVTPAYALSGWMTVFVDDFVHEREIASLPHDSEMVQTILPPGGMCFYYARTFHPVTRELKPIAGSIRAIYAYGEVRYKDIFGIEHFAKFRIKCAGERNLATGSFDHCLGGNEAS